MPTETTSATPMPAYLLDRIKSAIEMSMDDRMQLAINEIERLWNLLDELYLLARANDADGAPLPDVMIARRRTTIYRALRREWEFKHGRKAEQ